MKGMKILGSALALVSCVALAGSALAQGRQFDGPGPGAPGFGPGGPGWEAGPHRGQGGPPPGLHAPPPEVLERLGLTDAQRDTLEALGEEELRKVIRLDAEARIAELDLRALAETDPPDVGAIDRQVERIASVRAQIMKARIATLLGVRATLTADQRAKLGRAMMEAAPPRDQGAAPARENPRGSR